MKKKSAFALGLLDPCCLTAHRKRFATGPFRMSALLGMAHCVAGLLAIRRKAFFQWQGMSKPNGIIFLPPLVSSLSAMIAAIGLCASNHAEAQSQTAPMDGIMYLEDADAMGDPIHNWSRDPAVTNPYV